MKAKIERGRFTFDVQDLIDSLSKEDRREVARYVAADKELFAAVLECVAGKSRHGSFFTEDSDGDWWFGAAALLELREKLLPLMPEVARGAVEEALRQRNDEKAKARRMWDWAWQLFHAWPDEATRHRPNGPDGWKTATEPTDAEVDALMTRGSVPSNGLGTEGK